MKPGYYGLGGWSAPPAAAAAASITFRDFGQHRSSSAIFDIVLNSMAIEPLDFIAGNLVIIFARLFQTGTTGAAANSTSSAATGWNKFGFHRIGPLEDTWCIAAAWKVVDGTETTVDLVDVGGAAGTVVSNTNYLAVAYDIVGTPTLVMSNFQISNTDVSAQTITSGGGNVPILAFSWAGGTTQPDQSFDTETPDQNIAYGSSAGGGSFVRLKTKIFTSAPANITTDFGDLGTGNGLISGYFEVTL